MNARPADPLSAAVAFLADHGDAEGQALGRAVLILATWRGCLRQAELWRLGPESTAILTGLIDARVSGIYSERDWRALGSQATRGAGAPAGRSPTYPA
jgi:hypothetical protein